MNIPSHYKLYWTALLRAGGQANQQTKSIQCVLLSGL